MSCGLGSSHRWPRSPAMVAARLATPKRLVSSLWGVIAMVVRVTALDCWAGDFNAATCCDKSFGPSGNPSCWSGPYTFDRCCGEERSVAKPTGKKEVEKSERKSGPTAIDGVVIGIDLGTTYSAVAVYRGGRVEVIPNDQGNRITPSMVAFAEGGERLVGEAAKNQLSMDPKNVLYDVKRLIGRGFQDRSVQMDKKSFTFKVVDRGGRPHIELEGGKKKTVVAPEEVSALVLQKMKAFAEAYLGEEVRHAVVTVPAYFNDNQRYATMVAGEIAGLNVARILNEPTAAALAYGLDHLQETKGKKEKRVLVYDLGGGTFDVSILVLADGVFQTLATCGNTHLGGEDFDRNVVNHMLEVFSKKSGVDPKNDRQAMQKLKLAVERAKRALSSSVQTRIEVEDFFDGHSLNEELTRAKFEQLNAAFFQQTLEPVKRVLKDAGLGKQEIDEIVLVGGSTRIPKVQKLIKDFFGLSKIPQHTVNPDEAVAAGAAIQGGILWSGSSANTAVAGTKTWDLVLLDVTPLSLGIEIEGGHMIVIIPRNTQLPTKKSKTFTTVHANQNHVYIPIYEGERPIANKNNKLGDMVLSGIPPAPAGVPQIDVTFRIDANGILHVTAQDQGTKNAAHVTINAEKGRLSEEEIERMVKKAQRYADKDRDVLSRNDARAALRAYLHSLETSVLSTKSSLSEIERGEIEEAVQAATTWLQETGAASVEEIQEQKQLVEDVASPIIARMYGGGGGGPSEEQGDWGDDDDEDTARDSGEETGGDDFYDQDAFFDQEL